MADNKPGNFNFIDAASNNDVFQLAVETKRQEFEVVGQEQEFEVVSLARKQLAKLWGEFATLTSSSEISQSAHSSTQKVRLPPIQIQNFDGQYYLNWQPFQELFTELIILNDDVSLIEKLHYHILPRYSTTSAHR